MAGLKYAFLLFMIILMRIFVVFVDDTSSSLQTFKEILAFPGKCFRSILLELSQGIFFKMIFLSFFSGPATITIISCSCRLWYWKEMKIGPSRKCILLTDWALCKKTNNREGGGGGGMCCCLCFLSLPSAPPSVTNSNSYIDCELSSSFLRATHDKQKK